MAQRSEHCLYGDTNESSCVPDVPPPPRLEPVRTQTVCALLTGQYLADVLTVWECYRDRRSEGAPLLLRFEDFDLLLSVGKRNELIMRRGAVSTERAPSADVDASAACSSEHDPESRCLAWVSAPDLADVVGQQVASTTVADPTHACVRLEDVALHLASDRSSVSYHLVRLP